MNIKLKMTFREFVWKIDQLEMLKKFLVFCIAFGRRVKTKIRSKVTRTCLILTEIAHHISSSRFKNGNKIKTIEPLQYMVVYHFFTQSQILCKNFLMRSQNHLKLKLFYMNIYSFGVI